MPSHRDPSGQKSGRAGLIALLLAGGLVAVLAVYGLINSSWLGDDGDTPAQAASTGDTDGQPTETTDAPTTDQSATETTDETSATTEAPADASSTTDAAAEAKAETAAAFQQSLAGCQDELGAAQDALDAAAVSANNWRLHYEASEDLNSGKINIDKADEIWAETKANGAEEVADFQDKNTAYDDLQGSCSGLTDLADLESADQDVATACAAHGTATTAALEAASAVNNQWDEHVQMMASKADFDPEEYVHEWHLDVAAAPPVTKAYEDALAELAESPACSTE